MGPVLGAGSWRKHGNLLWPRNIGSVSVFFQLPAQFLVYYRAETPLGEPIDASQHPYSKKSLLCARNSAVGVGDLRGLGRGLLR